MSSPGSRTRTSRPKITYAYITDAWLAKTLHRQGSDRVVRWLGDQYFTAEWPHMTGGGGRVVVAWRDDRLVGFFRYQRYVEGRHYAWGTWVEASLRRHGIAGTLWGMAIRRSRIRDLTVTTTSRAGNGLVRYVKKAHPNVGVTHLRS